MIGFGAHPRNQMFGHVTRQDAARASFFNRILANVKPARLHAYFPGFANTEYGSTFPFQQFGQSTRINRPDGIDATAYQVQVKPNTMRPRLPSPLKGGSGGR